MAVEGGGRWSRCRRCLVAVAKHNLGTAPSNAPGCPGARPHRAWNYVWPRRRGGCAARGRCDSLWPARHSRLHVWMRLTRAAGPASSGARRGLLFHTMPPVPGSVPDSCPSGATGSSPPSFRPGHAQSGTRGDCNAPGRHVVHHSPSTGRVKCPAWPSWTGVASSVTLGLIKVPDAQVLSPQCQCRSVCLQLTYCGTLDAASLQVPPSAYQCPQVLYPPLPHSALSLCLPRHPPTSLLDVAHV